MSALLGKKLGMTQVFTEKGDCVPVTVVPPTTKAIILPPLN